MTLSWVLLLAGAGVLLVDILIVFYVYARRFGLFGIRTYEEPILQTKVMVYMVQPLATVATACIALGGILLTWERSEHASRQAIEASDRTLNQARDLAFIQTRPYLSVQSPSFERIYEALPDEPEDIFTLTLPIVNAGAIPATKISTSLDFVFDSAQKSHHHVKLTTDPQAPTDIPIPQSNYSLAVPPKQNRFWILRGLRLNKIDGKSIWVGETPVMLKAMVRYSAPGVDQSWTYEMEAELRSNGIRILNEKVT